MSHETRLTCCSTCKTPPILGNFTPSRIFTRVRDPHPNSTITSRSHYELWEKKKNMEAVDASELRSEFLRVLRSRRPPEVPLVAEPAKPVMHPLYQGQSPTSFCKAMTSCPKEDIPNLKDSLVEENLYLHTEAAEQGRVPLLISSMKESSHEKRPAVVFLHSTHKCKEWLRPLLEAYASRGYVAVAMDSRYHGERAKNISTYQDALVSAWQNGDTMPFIYDTGFRWAIEHERWHARVDSIKPVFIEATSSMGKKSIDKEVVEKVWDRIAPGLAGKFDSPYTIPAIAPRPLLILKGFEDPRCPLAGLEDPVRRACKAYEEANCLDYFKLEAEPDIAHEMTSSMIKKASDWFDKFLK
ncbi:hypothetical protein Droror1_Dr00017296 [Drosera rotundifolia]